VAGRQQAGSKQAGRQAGGQSRQASR